MPVEDDSDLAYKTCSLNDVWRVSCKQSKTYWIQV